MKSLVKLSSLFLVLILVFVSGCTSNASTTAAPTGNNGLVVKNLKSQGTFAGAGSQVSVSFDVENVGGGRATNACAQVFGQSWTKKTGDSTAWYGLGSTGDDNCAAGGIMIAPILSANAPGDKDFVNADFDTNTVANPVDSSGQNYKVTTRLFSKYETRGVAQVNAVSSNEYAKRQRDGKLVFSQIPTTSTAGPIKLTIQGQHPVKLSRDTVSLRLNIVNVGGGRVFDARNATGKTGYGSLGVNDYGTVRIKSVSVNGNVATANAAGAVTGEEIVGINATSCSIGSAIKVPDGVDGATRTCSFKVQGSEALTDTNVDVQVVLEYGYMTEYPTTVTIKQSVETGEFSKGMLKVIPYLSSLV